MSEIYECRRYWYRLILQKRFDELKHIPVHLAVESTTQHSGLYTDPNDIQNWARKSEAIGEVHAQNPTAFPVVFFWPDKGHEESRVHAKLENYRLKLGGGREWFRTNKTPFDMYMHCAKLIGDDYASMDQYNLFQQSLHMLGYPRVRGCPRTELTCSDNANNSMVATQMSQPGNMTQDSLSETLDKWFVFDTNACFYEYDVKNPLKRKRQKCDHGDKRTENDRQMMWEDLNKVGIKTNKELRNAIQTHFNGTPRKIRHKNFGRGLDDVRFRGADSAE